MRRTIPALTERERLLLGRARRVVYEVPSSGPKLALHLYLPKNLEEGPPRACLLFLHGGDWSRGSAAELAPHALHYVERGAVCALAEYRHRGSHPEAGPGDALRDASAAAAYLRREAGVLNVDPKRLVALGAGSGGHLAASLALGPKAGIDEFSSRPDAAVIIGAVFELVEGGPGHGRCGSPAEARSLGLSRRIRPGAPPMLVVHGTADRVVPFADAEGFVERMARKRNRCRLVEFEGRDREFHHLNLDPGSYEALLAEIDGFLDETGILPRRAGEPGPLLVSGPGEGL